jgi:trimethylamine--corrinoid protein Co-methyltransferase
MKVKGYTRKFKPLQILTEQELESIHKSTLHVLDTVGIRFESNKALTLLKNAGCRVEDARSLVRFPPALVEECLRKCPSSFAITARDHRHSLRFGGNSLHFYNSVGLQTIDLDTWEPRKATMSEQNDGVRVLDALDNLHLVNSYTPYMEIEGVPSSMLLLETLASRLKNTTKVTASGYSKDSEIFAIKMAKEIGIELLGCVMAGPPLRYYQDACKAAFRYVEAGFPIFLTSGVSYGATGPVTIAGSTITNNAELIAGIVLVQLIRPGTGVLVADFTFPMNMQYGIPVFGSLSSALHTAMFGQIWRKYEVPLLVSTSGYSNAKKPDFQCGHEKTFAGLAAALSGANVVSMHGGIFAELSYHPVQSVLDDDIAGMIGRFLQGADVNDETLAVDLIETVGPGPAHYLETEHTFAWWKKEQYKPKTADWLPYDSWIQEGKKTAIDYAMQRMDEILAYHRIAVPLTRNQEDGINRIMEEAKKYYGADIDPQHRK